MMLFKKKQSILIFGILLLLPLISLGQVESDCENVVAVCDNAGSNGIVGGAGNDDFNGASQSGCLGTGGGGSTTIESNSAWYTFTLAVDGQFGFDIAPVNLGEDWDFGLYGPFSSTTGNCSNLGSPNAACNYSGTPGYTGVGVNPTTGTQTGTYDPWVNGVTGETYVLMINNYTATNTGFVLTFTGDIFDNHTAGLDCSVVTPITYCTGDNIYLDATTPNATSYIWDENGTPLSETGPILSGILATTTQYHVEAYNSSGVLAGEQTFNVTVSTPNAGTAVTIADICDTETALDLTSGLTGQDAGGTWNDDDGTGGLTGNTFDATGVAAGTYNFTYEVTLGTCPPDTETVQVTVIAANANSGTAVTPNLTLCNTATALDLDTSLTGQDAGGTWNDDDGTGGLTVNMFDPIGLATGSYDFTYTVMGTAPCTDVSTTISIEVTAAPNAGTAVAIADICDTETALDLATGLTGQDAGGTWNDDDGTGGLTGNTFDATGVAAGTYNFTYTVAPTSPCAVADSETVQVTVVRSPTSGTAVTPNLTLCNTTTALDLDTSLTGQDAGGAWNDDDGTGGLTVNMFDPTGLATGSYDFTYTVAASGPCPQSQTTVSVEVTAAPNAGTAQTIADICDTETALDLTTGLTGQDAGGTWNDDDTTGGLTGNTFDATGVAAGTYNFTYTVAPTSPCAVADSETVQVTVVRSPTSGTAVTPNLTLCNTTTALDLDTSLTGADAGGTWNDDNTTGGLTANMFDPTGLATGSYDFTYTVAALGPCPQSQTTVTVEVTAAPNAGTAETIPDICDIDTVDLYTTGLTGADTGGTWSDDDGSGGTITGNTFDATGVAAGTYNFTYTVAPTSPCAIADNTQVQVTVIRSPDAGINADDFFCMTDVSRDLYNTLGGTPDLGGTWSPTLTSGTGAFNPAVDPAGVYTYTVSGSGACVDATATVTVTLSEAPIITSIDVVDFSENNTITVNVNGIVSGTAFGIGDFEYSIDGVNFQSENIFDNVAPGTYTVTVRDINGCLPEAVIVDGAIVMGAPKFFTPNNDTENDTWQIVNIQSQPAAQVSIYDRFGKLLTRFDGTSEGWNGYYNNESMPSTDYWFSVVMNDAEGNPIVRRGHFSLIRREP